MMDYLELRTAFGNTPAAALGPSLGRTEKRRRLGRGLLVRRGEAQGGSEARGINFAEVVEMPRFQQGKTVFAAVSEQRAEDASCGVVQVPLRPLDARGGTTRQLDADECSPCCSEDRASALGAGGSAEAALAMARGVLHFVPQRLKLRGLNIQWPFSRLILGGGLRRSRYDDTL